MEAKEVINKILSEAEAQADEIIAQANKELADYNRQTEQQLSEFSQRSSQLAQSEADDKKQRMLASARMNSRKQILTAKQKVLSDVFAKAGEKLLAMGSDSYKELFTRLIYSAIESGDETVAVGRREDVLDASFVEQLNSQYKGEIPLKLKFSEQRGDFDRGVLLKRGDVRVNISVEVLLQMARESLETAIAGELFVK